MKLYYDKNAKDPTYFIQKGIRIGKKTTTKNICRIGKHSELLAVTDDPLSYAQEKVREANEKEKKSNKVVAQILIDYSEQLITSGDIASKSTELNVGYFFISAIYKALNMKSFFKNILESRKTEFVSGRCLSPGTMRMT